MIQPKGKVETVKYSEFVFFHARAARRITVEVL